MDVVVSINAVSYRVNRDDERYPGRSDLYRVQLYEANVLREIAWWSIPEWRLVHSSALPAAAYEQLSEALQVAFWEEALKR